MTATAFTPTILYLTAGLIIWGVRFLAVYALTGIACSRGWADAASGLSAPVPLAIAASSVLAAAGCAAVLVHAWTRLRTENDGSDRFIHQVAALVAAIAALAIVWETLAVVFVPFCA